MISEGTAKQIAEVVFLPALDKKTPHAGEAQLYCDWQRLPLQNKVQDVLLRGTHTHAQLVIHPCAAAVAEGNDAAIVKISCLLQEKFNVLFSMYFFSFHVTTLSS